MTSTSTAQSRARPGRRGPRTAAGKARAARNALKHGMRAAKYLVLPEEDAAEFAELEAALIEELAPVGARRSGAMLVVASLAPSADAVSARSAKGSQARRPCSPDASQSLPGGSRGRIAWPPERGWGPVAGRRGVGAPFPNQSGDAQPGGQESELFAERRFAGGSLGHVLIRDGNGTRSFATVGGSQHRPWWWCAPTNRYRGAAMAEFWRALKMLKAVQTEQAKPVERAPRAGLALVAPDSRPAARATVAPHAKPNKPEPRALLRLDEVTPEPGAPGRALHEPAAPWLPDKPETGGAHRAAPACRTNPRPQLLIGRTMAADGAQPTTAALLQSMPGVRPALLELADAEPNEFEKARHRNNLALWQSADRQRNARGRDLSEVVAACQGVSLAMALWLYQARPCSLGRTGFGRTSARLHPRRGVLCMPGVDERALARAKGRRVRCAGSAKMPSRPQPRPARAGRCDGSGPAPAGHPEEL
jgi:hypothetical protein